MDKITPFISPAYSVPVPKSVSSVIIDIGLDDRYKVPGSSFRVAFIKPSTVTPRKYNLALMDINPKPLNLPTLNP